MLSMSSRATRDLHVFPTFRNVPVKFHCQSAVFACSVRTPITHVELRLFLVLGWIHRFVDGSIFSLCVFRTCLWPCDRIFLVNETKRFRWWRRSDASSSTKIREERSATSAGVRRSTSVQLCVLQKEETRTVWDRAGGERLLLSSRSSGRRRAIRQHSGTVLRKEEEWNEHEDTCTRRTRERGGERGTRRKNSTNIEREKAVHRPQRTCNERQRGIGWDDAGGISAQRRHDVATSLQRKTRHGERRATLSTVFARSRNGCTWNP